MAAQVMKKLGSLRHLSAAFFFAAVFYATYDKEPARAAICVDGTIYYEGPNTGSWSTMSARVDYWDSAAVDQATDDCPDLCGSGWVWMQGYHNQSCCDAGSNDWQWEAGILNCTAIG